MKKSEFICIQCPMGCRLRVEVTEDNTVADISGAQCRMGTEYARQEAIAPLRILTALVRVSDRDQPLSVKSAAPVPLAKLLDCAKVLRRTRIDPPVRCGDPVILNICDTGVDIVATQDVRR